MSDYRYSSAGEDVGLGSLTVLDPQPSADFLQVVERSYGIDGSAFDHGNYVIWRFNVLNVSTYQSILTTLGIIGAVTNRGTLYTPNKTGTYTRYNGTAVQPLPGEAVRRDRYFLRNIEILIHSIEVAA